MLSSFVSSSALAFSAPAVQRAPSARAAVSMSAPVKPADFPVKNVWTTVCSSKDLKASRRPARCRRSLPPAWSLRAGRAALTRRLPRRRPTR